MWYQDVSTASSVYSLPFQLLQPRLSPQTDLTSALSLHLPSPHPMPPSSASHLSELTDAQLCPQRVTTHPILRTVMNITFARPSAGGIDKQGQAVMRQLLVRSFWNFCDALRRDFLAQCLGQNLSCSDWVTADRICGTPIKADAQLARASMD